FTDLTKLMLNTRETLRPETEADGVSDYITGKLFPGRPLDGIADYKEPSSISAEFETAVPVNPVLVASGSELRPQWINNVERPSDIYRDRAAVTRPLSNWIPKPIPQNSVPSLTALTTLPVVDGEGVEAPAVVIEAIPEPEESTVPDPIRTRQPKKRKYRGFSGFISVNNRSFDSDGFSLTTGASYKPVKDSYWFIRGSWNYRLSDEEFRYTWGIGYDDWHPGTFSVQLNHWGPLLPGDYLDIDNAIASATYKFKKNAFMKKHGVSSSVTLSQKISGDPVFSWSNSWTPAGKWFVRSTLSQPIKGGDLSWSYGFGLANYSPFTFSFEYNNWGYNKAFETNFQDNASLSFTYRWRY
ncbi:MAG: hypothetical protein KTR35_10610, partial [Gammaproteobacteria bacterium]|nr:hypothetical protein [Gammaproteobacteria bacterium]